MAVKELGKESPKVTLNLFNLASPNLVVQAVCNTCFEKYFGIFSLAGKIFVRRRLLILLALVLSQIVIGGLVVYHLSTSDSNLKPIKLNEINKRAELVNNKKPDKTTLSSEKIDRTLFVVTPTYARNTQKGDLTSLSQTLALVDNLVWIVVEDSETPSKLVSTVLSRSQVKNVHLVMPTPKDQMVKNSWWSWLFHKPHRGVAQRNAALTWLKKKHKAYSKNGCDGVVYFADDDNHYDVQLFELMRTTKVLSVWAVGFRGGLSYEGPVCKNGNLIHWRMRKVDTKIRAFPIDMAGFAVNLCQIIQRPFAGFESSVPFGHLENAFVLQFISTQHEAECIGSNKEVLVWHVKTKEPSMRSEKYEPAEYDLMI